MIPGSKIQEVAKPVMSNADNVSPNALALPAVPVLGHHDKGKQNDSLKNAVQRELPELMAVIPGDMLANMIDPDRKHLGELSEQSATMIKTIKQLMAAVKKRLGGDIALEGIAMGMKDFITKKGPGWVSALPASDIETEAKALAQFMNREGEFKMDNFKTVSKEFAIKDNYERGIANAIGTDMMPGGSFFGNVYFKKMEFTRSPGDPAMGGNQISKEREVSDHFECTINYAHNTFTIKDDELGAHSAFAKTGAEITMQMMKHVSKYVDKVTGTRGAQLEIQMLMEFNVPAG